MKDFNENMAVHCQHTGDNKWDRDLIMMRGFATQPTSNSYWSSTRPKMLSLTNLVSFLPEVSCSAVPPENQSLQEKIQFNMPFKEIVNSSDGLLFYNLGVQHANLCAEIKDTRKRVDEMQSKSETTEKSLKKMNRKFVYTYLAIGALAASCFGNRALTKIKSFSANFK